VICSSSEFSSITPSSGFRGVFCSSKMGGSAEAEASGKK
jgi:hypothetical protein